MADVPTRRPPIDRTQFPVADRCCYLNNAGVVPLSLAAVEAMDADNRSSGRFGSVSAAARGERIEQVRAAAARLIGVNDDDLAFVANTTTGLSMGAGGMDWGPDDRVVVPDLEFPSTLFPWLELNRRHGVSVDLVSPVGDGLALPLDAFADALESGRGRVRVVTLSWIQYGRGWRTDLAELAELCHHHGALLYVDAIQGLGVVPVDLAACGVDLAAASTHKWLLGPEGLGLLYVSAALRERLRVTQPGWASVTDRYQGYGLDLDLDASARRYESGTFNVSGIAGLGAGLNLLDSPGVEAVWAHVDRLCDRLVDELGALGASVLSDRSPAARSSLVTCTVPGIESVDAVDRLAQAGVVVASRGGGIRFSPHGWNDDRDIDRALEAVAALA